LRSVNSVASFALTIRPCRFVLEDGRSLATKEAKGAGMKVKFGELGSTRAVD